MDFHYIYTCTKEQRTKGKYFRNIRKYSKCSISELWRTCHNFRCSMSIRNCISNRLEVVQNSFEQFMTWFCWFFVKYSVWISQCIDGPDRSNWLFDLELFRQIQKAQWAWEGCRVLTLYRFNSLGLYRYFCSHKNQQIEQTAWNDHQKPLLPVWKCPFERMLSQNRECCYQLASQKIIKSYRIVPDFVLGNNQAIKRHNPVCTSLEEQ